MSSNRNNNQNLHEFLLDWSVETVLLTFFPLILTCVISLCASGKIDFYRVFGDGELILSSFCVIAPSVLKLFNMEKRTFSSKKFFYITLILAFLMLGTYVGIKLDANREPMPVYISSVLWVISSILFARAVESFLYKGGSKNG